MLTESKFVEANITIISGVPSFKNFRVRYLKAGP